MRERQAKGVSCDIDWPGGNLAKWGGAFQD
jgi:hypothetical protein